MTEERTVRIDYAGNSNKDKIEEVIETKVEEENSESAERPKLKPVITGKATQRKEPIARKLVKNFISEDAGNVGSHVFFEIMMPATKRMLADAGIGMIERLFFGEVTTRSRGGSSGGKYSGLGSTNYSRMSSEEPRRNERREWTGRQQHSFDDIIIEKRVDAENILNEIDKHIDKYGVASVADLLDLAQLTSSYVDNKYGWTEKTFSDARVVMARGGYLLDVPRPIKLD